MKKDIERLKKIRQTINESISDRWFMWGMTREEITSLCRKLKCPVKAFWKSFGVGNTVATSMCKKCTHLESIFYTCDIEQALARIFKYRVVTFEEWD